MKPLASIPRTSGLPLLGNLLDFRRDRIALQERVFAECGDMGIVQLAHVPVVMISAADLAHEVLVEKSEAFIKSAGLRVFSRPLLGNGLLTSEHDVHKRQRKLMSSAFQHRRLATYADVMVSHTERMLAGWQSGRTVGIHGEMMALTLSIVAKTLFDAEVIGEAEGVGHALEEAMRWAMEEVASLVHLPLFVPTPRNLRQKKNIHHLDAIIYRIIHERRASGLDKGDVLSTLLSAEDELDKTRMNDVEVRDEVMTLFLAGHETTANALTWTFYLLAQNPKARARLEEELDRLLGDRPPAFEDVPRLVYTNQVIKESMRLYPPAYLLGRESLRDVEIGGHLIPKGTVVMVNIFAMHRRKDVFPDPEVFDPDRFEAEAEKRLPRLAYLPFGAGPRICIGNHFAMMEAVLLLASIAQGFELELIGAPNVALDPLITLRPRADIAMRLLARAEKRAA